MSISAFFGDAGGGKSYSLNEVLIASVKLGIPVITTLELQPIFFEHFPSANITFCKTKTTYQEDGIDYVEEKRVVDFSKPVRGAIYILDELHEVFDLTTDKQWFKSGVAQNHLPQHIVNFISKRRQYLDNLTGRHIQIVIDTQTPVLLASWFKSQIEKAVYCIKHLEVGTCKRFKRITFTGQSAKENKTRAKDISQREILLKYKPEVYCYYKSFGYAVSDVTVVDESRVAKSPSLLRSWYFYAIVLLAYFSITSIYDLVTSLMDDNLISSSASPVKTVSASTVPAAPVSLHTVNSAAIPAAVPAVVPSLTVSPVVSVVPSAAPVSVLRGGGFVFNSDIGGQCFGVVIKKSKKYHYCKKDGQSYYVELKL